MGTLSPFLGDIVPVFFRESIRLFCKNPFQPAVSTLQADLTMKNPSRRMEPAGSIRLFLFFSQKQTNTEAALSRYFRRTPVGWLLRRHCEASPWEEAPKLVPARVHRLGVFPAHGPGALPAHGPGALPGERGIRSSGTNVLRTGVFGVE